MNKPRYLMVVMIMVISVPMSLFLGVMGYGLLQSLGYPFGTVFGALFIAIGILTALAAVYLLTLTKRARLLMCILASINVVIWNTIALLIKVSVIIPDEETPVVQFFILAAASIIVLLYLLIPATKRQFGLGSLDALWWS